MIIALESLLSANRDSPSTNNRIVRPQGIIFQDTYNNFVFPIMNVQLDTSKAEISRIFRGYREKYIEQDTGLLPWHYMIEMIGSRYYILQTRPLDLKFPLSNQEVLERKPNLISKDSIAFFQDNVYRINDMIHICLIGDTNLDIYPHKLYRMIGQVCVSPMFRDMRIPGSPTTRIFDFNLGKNFSLKTLISFSRK